MEEELFIVSEEQGDEPQVDEAPKKTRKPRKPMSEERKEILRKQLKKAREASLAKRKAGKEAKQKAVEAVKKQVKTPAAELNVPYNMLRDEISGLKELIKNMQVNQVSQPQNAESPKQENPAETEMRIETPKFDIDFDDEESKPPSPLTKPKTPAPVVTKPAPKPKTPAPVRAETPADVRNFISHINSSSFSNSYF